MMTPDPSAQNCNPLGAEEAPIALISAFSGYSSNTASIQAGSIDPVHPPWNYLLGLTSTSPILCNFQEPSMPKFVIEREIPRAGEMTRDQLRDISQTSCRVLAKLGFEIQWIQSYVTGDKVYCIYRFPSDGLIRQHAELGGFPAYRISAIRNVIDPTTAEL
jgi:hypothetical protein